MATNYSHQDEDLAQLQELSNKWEPESEGPLVSELLASSAITTEYANADPVYQAKTAVLPQSYAHYRTCKGDGHCGWRAVAFCYFESLVRLGVPHKFQEEISRLKSLHNLLNEAGFQEDLYEDFADDTFQLLQDASLAQDGVAVVLNAFNDANRAMSIITYLKLLTSSWMQKYPDGYQAYLSEPIQSYCRSSIEPAVCEIEHVGMTALVDVLIKPAGLAVEIHYLDRSPGTEVNAYRYSPDSGPTLATFRLLYRPGHYDILYKAEDVARVAPLPPVSTHQDVMVALQHHSTEHFHHRTAYQQEPTIEIPGMSFYPGPQGGWPPAFCSPYDAAPSPISPSIPSPRAAVTPSYPGVPSVHSHDVYIPSVPMAQQVMPTITIAHHRGPPIDRGGPFRPSMWELETNFASPGHHPPLCQTAIFRNSHYNVAHFNNPEFMPEQWKPESEYTTGERPRKKSSHSQ